MSADILPTPSCADNPPPVSPTPLERSLLSQVAALRRRLTVVQLIAVAEFLYRCVYVVDRVRIGGRGYCDVLHPDYESNPHAPRFLVSGDALGAFIGLWYIPGQRDRFGEIDLATHRGFLAIHDAIQAGTLWRGVLRGGTPAPLVAARAEDGTCYSAHRPARALACEHGAVVTAEASAQALRVAAAWGVEPSPCLACVFERVEAAAFISPELEMALMLGGAA